jgi:GNAT superfamily N-acetyltransferase
MEFRFATADDIPLLAQLNQQLQIDENHRSRMSLAELEPRMAGWMAGGYMAVIFERGGQTAGYALFRREPDHYYLKQFFVCREVRRKGIGRAAIQWLRRNAWTDLPRVCLDVLLANPGGIAFWRAIGFRDYALTMEIKTAGKANRIE